MSERGKELLVTKSGVSLELTEVGWHMPLPSESPAYKIKTDLRTEYMDHVILTTDEAAEVAFAILKSEFERKGLKLANAPLLTCARLLGVDLENLT